MESPGLENVRPKGKLDRVIDADALRTRCGLGPWQHRSHRAVRGTGGRQRGRPAARFLPVRCGPGLAAELASGRGREVNDAVASAPRFAALFELARTRLPRVAADAVRLAPPVKVDAHTFLNNSRGAADCTGESRDFGRLLNS